MFKKVFNYMLFFVILFGYGYAGIDLVFASNEISQKMVYEGETFVIQSSSTHENAMYYSPVAQLMEKIGGTYEWDKYTDTITCKLGKNIVELEEGASTYLVNGQEKQLDMPLFIEDYVPYVPIEQTCEGLGLNVVWDENTNIINLVTSENATTTTTNTEDNTNLAADTNTTISQNTTNLENIDSSSLDDVIKPYGDISVYYENLETGYVYTYNPDKIYFAASVVKAPYSLYVYNLAEKGEADLTRTHTYTSDLYRGGTGVIKDMKTGITFTENELLLYTIRNSDNIAFRMLINQYGIEGYEDFVASLGADPNNVKTVTGANMTAIEAGIFAKEIYKYIESDGVYSQQFKVDLMSTTNPMIVSDFPIARKYGWADNSFHDMAIVYSESPYVLVIMTEWENGTSKNFAAFKKISMAVQDFNEENFVDIKD